MELQITPEDVESMVKDAVLKAGMGTLIASKVNDALKSYNSPVDAAVKDFVAQVAVKLVREKFSETITSLVNAEVEARVTKDIMQSIVSAAVEKMVASARDRY